MATSTRTWARKRLQGCAPVAAGTCVARVLGAEMTGDPAMLASGCEEDIEVIPKNERRLVNRLDILMVKHHHSLKRYNCL